MGENSEAGHSGVINGGCVVCNQWPHAADCPHDHPGVHRLIRMIEARVKDIDACVDQRNALAIVLGRVTLQIQEMSEATADTVLGKAGISAIIHLFRTLRLARPGMENFATGNFDGNWYITVQNRDGMTPAERITNLTAQNTSLQNENDRLVQVIEKLQREAEEKT